MSNTNVSSLDRISILQKYREKNYKFDVSVGLLCVICKLILVDAIQTKCGCRYCRECIDNYIRNGPKKCVGDYDECTEIIQSYIPDTATNREIGQLKVKCLYDDCKHEDQLRNMVSHFAECRYRIVICNMCQSEYPEINKEHHLANDCPMRKITCPHCQLTFTNDDFIKDHLNCESIKLCTKYMAICPYECDTTNKVNMSQHRKGCKNRPEQCGVHALGCKERIPRDKKLEHLESHIVTMADEMSKLKLSNQQLEREIVSLGNQNQQHETLMKTMEMDYERKLGKLETNLKEVQPRVVDKKESAFRNGKYIWKIPHFSQMRDNARRGVNVSVISDSFYTSEFGYRMCLKIYPDGDGMGKGTHLSVFFVLMKGEYDDLQIWPFRNKVTLSILEDLVKSNSHTDTFKPDARSVCYLQPVDEFNIASGSPKFISFGDLEKYIKNDSFFIQINVLPIL